MNTTEIQHRIQNARDLDFGTIFNQSMELFKKVWVQGLVTLLLNFVLAIPVVMLVYIPLLILGLTNAFTINEYGNSSYRPEIGVLTIIIMFLLYIFMIIALSAISTGLKAAFYKICSLKENEEIGKEDYFYFLKKPYLLKTIKLGVTVIGISVLGAALYIAIFFTVILSNNFESVGNFYLLPLSLLPLLYLIVPLSLVFVVYAFNPDKSVSEIIKLSFNLGNKKWLISFGLMFISGILAGIVGMLMCFVGVYVTASFSYLPAYFIYKDVIGFDDNDDIKRIEGDIEF